MDKTFSLIFLQLKINPSSLAWQDSWWLWWEQFKAIAILHKEEKEVELQKSCFFLGRLQRPATAWEQGDWTDLQALLFKVHVCSATLGSQVLLLGVSRWLRFNPHQGLWSPRAATPVPNTNEWESQRGAKHTTDTQTLLSAQLSSLQVERGIIQQRKQCSAELFHARGRQPDTLTGAWETHLTLCSCEAQWSCSALMFASFSPIFERKVTQILSPRWHILVSRNSSGTRNLTRFCCHQIQMQALILIQVEDLSSSLTLVRHTSAHTDL